MYLALVSDTFGTVVSCGLNNGAGVMVGGNASGTLVAGCAGLPNKGKTGQLKEFDSVDAGGKRSATFYAYDGLKPNFTNHLVMLAYGALVPGAQLTAGVDRIAVGAPDLFYKVTQGYRNYAKAQDYGVYKLPASGKGDGFEYFKPLWENVLAPAHGR